MDGRLFTTPDRIIEAAAAFASEGYERSFEEGAARAEACVPRHGAADASGAVGVSGERTGQFSPVGREDLGHYRRDQQHSAPRRRIDGHPSHPHPPQPPLMRTPDEQAAIRQDIFSWLEHQEIEFGGYEFRRDFLRNAYTYGGEVVALMDRQNGIWNPSGFDSTLSITRTLKGPYADDLDGVIQKYSYERLPDKPLLSGRNLKLRAAAANGDPLIMFQEVLPSLYFARYPVFIVRDDPDAGYVDVALDQSLMLFGDPYNLTVDQRRYAERVIQVRLHQKAFRSRVLHAYQSKCAVCTLAHRELLDAAHITPDGAGDSTTSVTNGLSLCKIHHAAYDRRLIGIDGGYRVHVRPDVLAEAGGSMLTHAIQAMHGRTLSVPRAVADQPDSDRLQLRYLDFVV